MARATNQPRGDDDGLLLVSPAFWIGGALSLGAWILLALAWRSA